MKQTMLLKLAPTIEQHQALLDTVHTFNTACNYIAEQAYDAKVANKFELQKMTYGTLRTTCHLPAQLAIRAISKATDSYKRDKSIKPTFRPEGAIVYDERVMSFKGLAHVSLLTLAGNADWNAAINISRAAVKQPIVSSGSRSVWNQIGA